MTSAVTTEVSRRLSVPAMSASGGGSILVKDGQRSRRQDNGSTERRRKVSFEYVATSQPHHTPCLSGSSRQLPSRRHSSIVPPNISALSPLPQQAGATLESLPEMTSSHHVNNMTSLSRHVTADQLIEACIKDAEIMPHPDPLPQFSKDMAAVLKDMRHLVHDDDDENDAVGGTPDNKSRKTPSNGSNETAEVKLNNGEARVQQKNQKVENRTVTAVKLSYRQTKQRRVSAPVTKAPNIGQLLEDT